MTRKTLLLLSLLAILFSACSDDENDVESTNPYFKHFTFLEFDTDVIDSNKKYREVGFYLQNFIYDVDNWEISARNKKTSKSYVLNVIENDTFDEFSLSHLRVDIEQLEIGDYNLLIKYKKNGDTFVENFIVRDNSDYKEMYYSGWSSDLPVKYYIPFEQTPIFFMFFKGDEIGLASNLFSYDLLQALAFQNKLTNKVYVSRRYTDKEGRSRLDVPRNMPDGYYYIYSGDESLRSYANRSCLIISKPATPKINKIKNKDGIVSINGSNFLIQQPSQLLPSICALQQETYLCFLNKKGDVVAYRLIRRPEGFYDVQINKEGTEIVFNTLYLPSGSYGRPITDREKDRFDGYVVVKNRLGKTEPIPLRIDY